MIARSTELHAGAEVLAGRRGEEFARKRDGGQAGHADGARVAEDAGAGSALVLVCDEAADRSAGEHQEVESSKEFVHRGAEGFESLMQSG